MKCESGYTVEEGFPIDISPAARSPLSIFSDLETIEGRIGGLDGWECLVNSK